MNSAFKLEICADSVESAINAQKGGADRVELCANMFEGGTTPSYGTVVLARKHLDIELYVMIRPRGGDFYYSDLEFEQMKLDIELLRETGIDGLVFGILKPDGSIDTKRTK
ncbi:MAG: copper homeostasis protein CutC, partial [Candidatus Cloacimonetes bacterium]|nr:copper homeostasis protein CutC [Candidatus Cloacimonadota bacterium]